MAARFPARPKGLAPAGRPGRRDREKPSPTTQTECVYEIDGAGWRRCVTHNTVPSPSLAQACADFSPDYGKSLPHECAMARS